MRLAIYIHVPFCKKKCGYCTFYSQKYTRDRYQAWLKALTREMLWYRTQYPQLKMKTLYIGGGTPSCLSNKQIETLLTTIHDNFGAEGIEKTIEMNPESVSTALLKTCQRYGINRISLGVQSLNNSELKFLGRIHSAAQAIKAITQIKESGCRNLNIDLMFGLPQSTKKSLAETVNQVMAYNPQHISTYALTWEKAARIYRQKRQAGVSDIEELNQYRWLRSQLKQMGYQHYEVSAFAKHGFQCQHNLNYWHRNAYIGLGPAASSFFFGRAYQNVENLPCYVQSPENTASKHLAKRAQPESVQIKEYVIAQLRLIKGLSLADFKRRFGFKITQIFESQIALLIQEKLIRINHGHLQLTTKGIYVLNDVLIRFM